MFTTDTYVLRARIAPAALAAAPALALGLVALPLLANAQRLWALAAFGLTAYVSLAAREAGNQIQPRLWEAWGGMPTTSRLRFRDHPNTVEIERRHQEVERILGGNLKLPTQTMEAAEPEAADVTYAAAMRRIVAKVRGHPDFPLLNAENRNYGFARNLLGLKRIGIACSITVLAISILGALAVGRARDWPDAAPLLLPIAVAIGLLMLWVHVDAQFVRPSADAYADRVIEALDELPSASR